MIMYVCCLVYYKHVSNFRCQLLVSRKIYLLDINASFLYIYILIDFIDFTQRKIPPTKTDSSHWSNHSDLTRPHSCEPKAWLFLSTAPSDAAPYAFIRLQVIELFCCKNAWLSVGCCCLLLVACCLLLVACCLLFVVCCLLVVGCCCCCCRRLFCVNLKDLRDFTPVRDFCEPLAFASGIFAKMGVAKTP